MIHADDPEARIGRKGARVLLGYKIQNLCTSRGVVLQVQVIPASEHDGQAAAQIVKDTVDFFGFAPERLLGDTSYGAGWIRQDLQGTVGVHAPIPASTQPTGLWDHSVFDYDREQDQYRCPQGQQTVRRSRTKETQGVQYWFHKKACTSCPQRAACTTAKGGRSVFRSDYQDMYQEANAIFTSEEGRQLYKKRLIVERVNQLLKNPGGLGAPRTKGKRALGIKALLAAMVTNLKYTVQQLSPPTRGFLRRSV